MIPPFLSTRLMRAPPSVFLDSLACIFQGDAVSRNNDEAYKIDKILP